MAEFWNFFLKRKHNFYLIQCYCSRYFEFKLRISEEKELYTNPAARYTIPSAKYTGTAAISGMTETEFSSDSRFSTDSNQ